MSKLFSIIAAAILASIILGIAWLYSQPNQWRIAHQATIDAPAAEIFAQLNSLKNTPKWSAWNNEQMPTLKSRYVGPDSGVGASEAWENDGSSGTTSIATSEPNRLIEYKVISSDGYFVGHGSYEFSESDGNTHVDWVYEGDMGNNLILKFIMLGLLPKMDEGNRWSLNNLKQQLEHKP